jgi:hypothetical protein
VHEQVFHVFDVFGEQSHVYQSYAGRWWWARASPTVTLAQRGLPIDVPESPLANKV